MAEQRVEQIRKGLDVCCTWVEFVYGDMRKDYEVYRRKDCEKCPYRDPGDPAGLNCGERLMHDACELIGDLQRKIRELEAEIVILRGERNVLMSERSKTT